MNENEMKIEIDKYQWQIKQNFKFLTIVMKIYIADPRPLVVNWFSSWTVVRKNGIICKKKERNYEGTDPLPQEGQGGNYWS